ARRSSLAGASRRMANRVMRSFYLLYLMAGDHRVSWLARAIAAVGVAYILSPIDLVADQVPVLGELDDLAIGSLAILAAGRLLPLPLRTELKAKAVARFP